jgi:hypothetical protein
MHNYQDVHRRGLIFASMLAFGIAVDMISTFLLIASGYREGTGLILLLINTSKVLLALWVVFWFGLAYFLYPLAYRYDFHIHFETIAMLYAGSSLLAGIGNLYLYAKFG